MKPHDQPSDSTQPFYDFWGERYDWFGFIEARAKRRALELLALSPGQHLLNVGIGTGKEHMLIQPGVMPGGAAIGVDLSATMLGVASRRSGAPVLQADARCLPFAAASFERLISTYLLDLIPAEDLPDVLAGFRRVLKPKGRMVLASLTEGVNLPSRAIVSIWKAAYALNPITCGGCRPLKLSGMVRQAGFCSIESEVIVQFGVPTEVIVAIR